MMMRAPTWSGRLYDSGDTPPTVHVDRFRSDPTDGSSLGAREARADSAFTSTGAKPTGLIVVDWVDDVEVLFPREFHSFKRNETTRTDRSQVITPTRRESQEGEVTCLRQFWSSPPVAALRYEIDPVQNVSTSARQKDNRGHGRATNLQTTISYPTTAAMAQEAVRHVAIFHLEPTNDRGLRPSHRPGGQQHVPSS
jgi:hypothetical protein